MTSTLAVLGLAFVLASSSPAAPQDAPGRAPAAQAPATNRLVPVSGILTDAAGAPLAGAQTVTFAIFEEADAGAALWTETQQVTADASGRYTALLGSVVALPIEIFRTEQARWLDVSVNGTARPRTMLVAVPYALKAADAETLGGKPLASFVTTGPDGKLQRADGATVSGASLVGPNVDGTGVAGYIAKWFTSTTLGTGQIVESGNNVGIGTTDPSEGGLISSKVTIRAPDNSTGLAISNQAGQPRFALNINSDGSWVTYDRSTGTFLPGIAQRGGRVGIATTDPQGGGAVDSKFTVRNLDGNTGIAVLNQVDQQRFALNTLVGGGWEMYDGGFSGTWTKGLGQSGGRLYLGTTGTGTFPMMNIVARPDTYGIDGIRADTSAPGSFNFQAFSTGASSIGLNVFASGSGSTAVSAVASGTNGVAVAAFANGPTIAYFTGTGNVGIGTSSPNDKLQVFGGDIRVGSGTVGCVKDNDGTVIAGVCSSDLRFKREVTPFARSLDAVARLQPVYFNWRSEDFPDRHFGTARSFGLIAQEVEAVLPELVTMDDKGYRAVRYNQLPFHMLQAIKDLKSENDALKVANDRMTAQLKEQEARLRRLEELLRR